MRPGPPDVAAVAEKLATAAPAAEIESETPAMAADDAQSDDTQRDAATATPEPETPAAAVDDPQSDDTQRDAATATPEPETPATAAADPPPATAADVNQAAARRGCR